VWMKRGVQVRMAKCQRINAVHQLQGTAREMPYLEFHPTTGMTASYQHMVVLFVAGLVAASGYRDVPWPTSCTSRNWRSLQVVVSNCAMTDDD
jgi:hypothetical protein